MIIQLDPPIPLVSPKGECLAHALIDYGPEHHLIWVCVQDVGGEIWSWPNTKVRGIKNLTMERGAPNLDWD